MTRVIESLADYEIIMRRPTAKLLSDLLQPVLAPALAAHGLATSQLIARWPEVAGPELAQVTRPLRIVWPRCPEPDSARLVGRESRQDRSGGTLVLLCEGAFALGVQHAAPLILERINALYGWQAVTKLSLRQGPVAAEEKQRISVRETSGAQSGAQFGMLGDIEDADLRRALQNLAKAVVRQGE